MYMCVCVCICGVVCVLIYSYMLCVLVGCVGVWVVWFMLVGPSVRLSPSLVSSLFSHTHTQKHAQQDNLVYRKMVKDVEKEETEVSNE